MAGIDYNIPAQIKGVQVESPMNAMMQAMQLRGLQESSEMNALRAQEYQQDLREKNMLAQIYANPNIKPGSQEFFAQVAQHAPRYYEKIATGEAQRLTGEAQRQTALATQQTREQQRQEAEQKQRLAKREFGLRKIASAPDYGQAASLIDRSVRTGELDREEADYILSRLTPDTDMDKFRSDLITELLPAEKALTAASDVEKAGLGVRKEKFDIEAKELDRDLTGFNKVYNPALISTTDKNVGRAQITQRLKAMYEQPKLGAEAAKFMPYEEALKQHLAAYEQDPDNYVAAAMDLTGEKIIEARQKAAEKREERARKDYPAYQLMEYKANREPLTLDEYIASRVGAATTPSATTKIKPTPESIGGTGEMIILPDGTKQIPEVTKIGRRAFGSDVHPLVPSLIAGGNEKMANIVQEGHKASGALRQIKDTLDELDRLEVEKPKGWENRSKVLRDYLKVVSTEGVGTKVQVNVPVAVSTEKKYGEKFAGNIADSDVALRDAAERAPDTAANANRILSLLQSGQVITGSAANVKLQMAKFLNLGGGNDSEAVTNTEILISSLADSTLGAIKSSGLGSGQGFTDKDREFLERAKAGQITYEATSLKRLAELAHKAAESSANKWNKRSKEIPKSAIEGTGISTEPVTVPSLLKSKSQDKTPPTNAKGWKLHVDANGNRGYVSPDGKQVEEVK